MRRSERRREDDGREKKEGRTHLQPRPNPRFRFLRSRCRRDPMNVDPTRPPPPRRQSFHAERTKKKKTKERTKREVSSVWVGSFCFSTRRARNETRTAKRGNLKLTTGAATGFLSKNSLLLISTSKSGFVQTAANRGSLSKLSPGPCSSTSSSSGSPPSFLDEEACC